MSILLLSSFLILSFFTPDAPHRSNTLEKKVYRFDAGEPAAGEGWMSLGVEATYTKERGYGWISPPESSFTRPKLDRFRAPALIDGLSGQSVAFRADVPAGRWWITLWMEAGLEDENTAELRINGAPVSLAWNAFNAPAEPREAIQDMYRVLHKPVRIGEEGLSFEMTGRRDSVRILAFMLHPEPSPEDAAFMRRLDALGSYSSMIYDPADGAGSVYETLTVATDRLADLREELSTDPEDLFAVFWRDRLDLQIRAERLLAMRGWEWANDTTGLSLFERIHQGIMILDGILDRPDAASYPLYERALLARGRLKYWLKVEGSEPGEIAGVRMPDLAQLHAMHPDDPLLAMYNGKLIDEPDTCDALPAPENAPEWAVLQRETLCRLRAIAAWWVNEQQAPNGEFGGKYGDDVELLRWWPALILSGDTTALAGWKRLADGVWQSGQIEDGYAKTVSDVEHASEFVSDTAPVMAMFIDDPMYTERLRPSARHFETLWTGKTNAGRRLFKSAWFSSSEVDTEPPKNRDTEYNTRAAKAVRYLAWKTRDPAVIDVLTEWAETWAEASMRTDKGKPRGIVPASIRFPDGAVNGDGDTWYDAEMYWSYFNWRGGGMMLEQLLFSYTMTKNEALLEPLIATLSLIEEHLTSDAAEAEPAPGSPAWTVQRLIGHTRFWSVASQWRLQTGDTRFDNLLQAYGTPYLRYRLTDDESMLVTGLQEILDKVRYNTPMLTYEAIHTDRIYVTHSGSGSSQLKAMLTGDGMIEDMSPYPAVSWSNTGEAFAAVVTDTGTDRLSVELFSFSEAPRLVEARLWQLEPGTYRLKLGDVERSVRIEKTGQSVELELPAGKLTHLSLDSIGVD